MVINRFVVVDAGAAVVDGVVNGVDDGVGAALVVVPTSALLVEPAQAATRPTPARTNAPRKTVRLRPRTMPR